MIGCHKDCMVPAWVLDLTSLADDPESDALLWAAAGARLFEMSTEAAA